MNVLDSIINGTVDEYFSSTGENKKKKKSLKEELYESTLGNMFSQTEVSNSKSQIDSSGYFKKSEGNWIDTILGTTGDIGMNALEGIMNIGEGIGDLITYGWAGIEEASGNKEKASQLRQNAQTKNTYDILLGNVEKNIDKNSILGEKSDSVVNSLGYIAGMTAVSVATGGIGGAAGTTGSSIAATVGSTATTFTSSMGNSMNEAYKNGATDEEAFKYGVIGGIAEAGTELMFGGLGKMSGAVGLSKSAIPVDDMLAKTISDKFKSTLGKNLSQFVIKAGAEGTEEVVSGIISAIGRKVTYMNEKEFSEILKDENLLEQFISGAVVSGIAQSPHLVKTTVQGADYSTGYTKNETKVYDTLVNEEIKNITNEKAKEQAYERKISEQENMLARKLTDAEKTQARKEIEISFENGEISTDNIQFDAKTRDKIEQQVEEQLRKGNIDTEQIRDIIGENVDISQDKLLQSSYIQAQRKSQVYKFEKTESIARNAVMESAVNANMNNTDLSRNFIDYVSKIAEDTGTAYRFTTSKQLEEMGFSKEGKSINGVVTKDGIVYLNAQSKDAMNYILGHETTHLLENTEEYVKLQDLVLDYARNQGIYEDAINNIKDTYKDTLETNEQFTNEVTSDLVGRLLFSDEKFISNLSTKEPNIFKKIYTYIKHIYKMATADSKQAKQLQEIKYNFDKAYKNIHNNKMQNNIYSIQTDNNGKKYVKVDTDQDIFEGIDEKDYNKIAKMYMQDYLIGETSLSNNDKAVIDGKSASKYANPGKKQYYFNEKMKLTPELKNILEIAQKDSVSAPIKDTSKYQNWEYYKFNFELDGKNFEGTINIGIDKNGNKHFYEINKIHFTGISSVSTNSQRKMDFINNSIASANKDVNTTTKYYMQESENNTLDNIVPIGNNYKVESEKVRVQEDSILKTKEKYDNTKLIKYLDKHKIDYEILENGQIKSNEVEISQILNQLDRNIAPVPKSIETKEIKEKYKQIEKGKREYEEILRKEKPTEIEKVTVDRLLKGEIGNDEIPKAANRQVVVDLYNAKNKFYTLEKEVKARRQDIVNDYRELAKNMTKNIVNWKDKKRGLQYQVNTMKRNLRDIIPDAKEADMVYNEYFKPITKNNATIEKEINKYNQRISEYHINNIESQYIQMIGENKYNPDSKLPIEKIQEFYQQNQSKIDIDKCNKAVDEFRNIYDELIEKVNNTLIDNGYKPIDYRKGYFPHFIEDKATSIIGKMAEKLGWKINKDTLPTDIAGITDQFKPGKRWTSFSQQRRGDSTDYNALKGFDNYIRGAMDVIYHTEDIQKLRALENEIRYQYSETGVQEKINDIYDNNDFDIQEKEQQIELVLDNIKNNPMGNLVTELKNYTNNLANKKATSDRGMEEGLGRQTYSVMSNIQNRVSANMVGANISSALTNFIPITQAWSQTSTKNLMRGIKESIAIQFKDDGFSENSTWLTNRTKAADRLYKTGLDKVNDKLGYMFEIVDDITSNTIVRAKYYDNIEKGMNEQLAMDNADEFAKDVMAGRSKGDMPTIFNKKNPLVKLFTAFQLEVNNQYGYMFKDIKTDLAGEAKEKLVGAFVKMFLGAFLYNMLSEKITGRKSAFSPIDLAVDSIDTLNNENMNIGDKINAVATDLVGEMPFVGGIAGGGRLPIQGAIPYSNPLSAVTETISDISKVLDNDETKKQSAIKSLQKEWSKPLFYVALPFAGGQLKKTVDGLSLYDKDLPIAGSYTNSGELRFTVDDNLATKIQTAIFGQYSTKNAREYFEKGYSPLTEKQTQELIESDIPINEYREYRNNISKIDKLDKNEIGEDTSKLEMKLDYINNLNLNDNQKSIMANNITTRKEKIDMSKYNDYDSLEEMDFAIKNETTYNTIKTITDYNTYTNYKEEISKIKSNYATDKQKKRAVVDYINDLPLSEGQKAVFIKLNYTSIDDNNQIVVDYINSLDKTKNEKIAIFEKLGFTYKDGRVYE